MAYHIQKFLLVVFATMSAAFVAAGEFSYQVQSVALYGASAGIEKTELGDGSVMLTATADNVVTNPGGQAAITYAVTYTPSVGETSLPSTAYVTMSFLNYFSMQSSSDEAYVADLTDGVTKVDEIDRSIYADTNDGTTFFGSTQQAVPLTMSGGVLQGTFTVSTNYVRASVATGSGRTSVAGQIALVEDVSVIASSVPPRQPAAGAIRATVKTNGSFVQNPSRSPISPPGVEWTGSADSKPKPVGATFDWNIFSKVDSNTTLGEQALNSFGYSDSTSVTQNYIITVTALTNPGSYALKIRGKKYRSAEASASPFGSIAFIQAFTPPASVTADDAHQLPAPSKLETSLNSTVTIPLAGSGRKWQGTYQYTMSAGACFLSGQVAKNRFGQKAVLHGQANWHIFVSLF